MFPCQNLSSFSDEETVSHLILPPVPEELLPTGLLWGISNQYHILPGPLNIYM